MNRVQATIPPMSHNSLCSGSFTPVFFSLIFLACFAPLADLVVSFSYSNLDENLLLVKNPHQAKPQQDKSDRKRQ